MLSSGSTANICSACSHNGLRLFTGRIRSSLNPSLLTLNSSLITPGAIRSHSSFSRLSPSTALRNRHSRSRLYSTSLSNSAASNKAAIFALLDRIHAHHFDLLDHADELGLLEEFPKLTHIFELRLTDEFVDALGHLNQETLTERVRLARQQFGDSLPEGELNEEETVLYTRLYGAPAVLPETQPDTQAREDEVNALFRDDGEGGLVEVEFAPPIDTVVEGSSTVDLDSSLEGLERRTRAVAEQLDAEMVSDTFEDYDAPGDGHPRTHPTTLGGKFATSPSTVAVPMDVLQKPFNEFLSDTKGKHMREAAYKLFDRSLSKSTTTASLSTPEEPIPLSASQPGMSDMEANLFLTVLYPGMYATSLSILTEVRKRLGTQWLRDLINQEGGPKVLDAGGAGAGILAWREALKAEWSLIYPDQPPEFQFSQGKSTVLVGSDALRLRTSMLLDNTTFIPRLPNYLHSPPQRKHFDVIIASHALMRFSEDYMRKEYVQNLWSMLNPNGGVLILVEKGIRRGFDVIGGAREMILEKLIASPGSTSYEKILGSSGEETIVQKEPGMIVAPCTNHSKCPIIIQGQNATNAAFSGYESFLDSAGNHGNSKEMEKSITPQVNHLSLPRILFPPIKRKGHVVMDMCTPAGKIERWTVSRSFSKQGYHDARKSKWGDLWSLGAKTRISRNLRLGVEKDSTSGDELTARKQKVKEKDQDPFRTTVWGPNPLSEEGIEIPEYEKTMHKFKAEAEGRGKRPRKKANKADLNEKEIGDENVLGARPDSIMPNWVKKMQKKLLRQRLEKRGSSDIS
ncbi:predicted protein [Uncinocarpus reesii 1704]|uniref:37S ribosomal protein Rsm22 n=1 Tax=Uncinocarpus reesii (strain UAMH 1704) TaxID=336963 RepID=C4JSU7_UNCRE|nr:uncharacterized protein UREG_05536 [Uncinocarpus reesii 1704]EEP80694.1 predicted protein [Uncinocarpus reesii 1704]